jgi:hypothetical protein
MSSDIPTPKLYPQITQMTQIKKPETTNQKQLSLVSNDQPRATITTIYTKLGDEFKLSAGRAMKGIDVSLIFLIPKVILDQYLHADLSLGHNGIISDFWASQAKEKATALSGFL